LNFFHHQEACSDCDAVVLQIISRRTYSVYRERRMQGVVRQIFTMAPHCNVFARYCSYLFIFFCLAIVWA